MIRSKLKVLAGIVLIAMVGVGWWGWSLVSRGFSARMEPSATEAFVARQLRRLAIPKGASEAKNPLKSSPEVIAGAKGHYADHCAVCHANDGSGNISIGKGLYPKPPDMRLDETQQLSDGELYYIIENGVRFTGMPAFGEESAGLDSEESWALVAFIRKLPEMSVEEVEAMKKMNPKSPAELEKEERIRKFLQGDDSLQTSPEHEHHH